MDFLSQPAAEGQSSGAAVSSSSSSLPGWGDLMFMDEEFTVPNASRTTTHPHAAPINPWGAAVPSPVVVPVEPPTPAANANNNNTAARPVGMAPATAAGGGGGGGAMFSPINLYTASLPSPGLPAAYQHVPHHAQPPPPQLAPQQAPKRHHSAMTSAAAAAAAAASEAAAAQRARGHGASPVSSSTPSVDGSVAGGEDEGDDKLDRRKRRHKATETVRRVRINSLIDEIRDVTAAPKNKKTEVLEHALDLLRDYHRLKAMETRMEEVLRRGSAAPAAPASQAPQAQPAAPSAASVSSLLGAASTTAAIAVWSLDMRIVDANDNFLELTGYARDEVERRSISGLALSRPDQLSKCMEAMTTLLSGRADTARMHKAVVRKDRSHVWVLSTAVLIDDPVRAKRHVVTVMQRVAPPSAKRTAQLQA